jgi:hypothetical protein
LVVRFPASPRVGRGARVADTAQLVDVFPTVLDLLNLETPKDLDRRSLFAGAQAPRPVVASLVLDGAQLHAIREFPWKLVRDLRTQQESLYRVNGAVESAAPEGPEASAARARLRGELDAHLARGAEQPSRPAADLPSDVEEALRELGYAD